MPCQSCGGQAQEVSSTTIGGNDVTSKLLPLFDSSPQDWLISQAIKTLLPCVHMVPQQVRHSKQKFNFVAEPHPLCTAVLASCYFSKVTGLQVFIYLQEVKPQHQLRPGPTCLSLPSTCMYILIELYFNLSFSLLFSLSPSLSVWMLFLTRNTKKCLPLVNNAMKVAEINYHVNKLYFPSFKELLQRAQ